MLHRKNSANQLLCTPLTQGRVVLYWNIYQYRCRVMTTRIASGFFQGWPHRQRPPSQTKSRPEIGQKPLMSEKTKVTPSRILSSKELSHGHWPHFSDIRAVTISQLLKSPTTNLIVEASFEAL